MVRCGTVNLPHEDLLGFSFLPNTGCREWRLHYSVQLELLRRILLAPAVVLAEAAILSTL